MVTKERITRVEFARVLRDMADEVEASGAPTDTGYDMRTTIFKGDQLCRCGHPRGKHSINGCFVDRNKPPGSYHEPPGHVNDWCECARFDQLLAPAEIPAGNGSPYR